MNGINWSKEWHWNYLWLCLYAIGVGVFIMGMPKYLDDLNFLWPFYQWFERQGITDPTGGGDIFRYGIPWNEFSDAYQDRWLNDNFRLVNVISIPLLLLPKWIGSTICLFAWIYAVIAGFRLAGISVGKSPLVVPGLLLLTYTLPWDDSMGSLVFHLNYMIPSAINIWLIRRLFINNGEDRSNGRAVATGFVGLLAGVCHEGFAGPTLVGIAAVMAIFRKCRRKDFFMACAGLAVGILLLSLVPGTRLRVSGVNSIVSCEFSSLLHQFISWRWGWWICLGALGLAAWRRKLSGMCRTPLFVFLSVSILVALTIALPVAMWPRAVWWSNFLITLLTIMVIRNVAPGISESYNRYTAAGAGLCLLVLYGNQITVGYYAVRIGLQNRAMIEHFKASPDEPFFGEVYMMSDMPWIAGYQPECRYAFNSHWLTGRYFQYPLEETFGRFWLMPKELEYVKDSESREVPGTGGAREYGGRYYVSEDSIPSNAGAGMMDMDLGKGVVKVPVILNRFRSKGDGKRYVWIVPKLNWWLTHTREIESIGKLVDIHPRWGWKKKDSKSGQKTYPGSQTET